MVKKSIDINGRIDAEELHEQLSEIVKAVEELNQSMKSLQLLFELSASSNPNEYIDNNSGNINKHTNDLNPAERHSNDLIDERFKNLLIPTVH
ncbi:MAG: hypothetical protein ACI93R_000768 [Flavobacteriales bacterium]